MYLERHPLAADNERGIAEFWLPELGLQLPSGLVGRALARLVARRVVAEVTMPDGSVIYRAGPQADGAPLAEAPRVSH